MSWLSDLADQFTGKKQQNIANAADTKATGQLGTGYNLGKTDLANTQNAVLGSNNYGDAINTIKWGGEASADATRRGYGDARTSVSSGYTGANQALNTGYDAAGNKINTSADKSIGYSRNYLDQAMGILKPGIDSYHTNQGILDQFANGDPGTYQQAYQRFSDSNAQRDQIARDNMNRLATAQGRSVAGNGRTGQMVTRADLERQSQDLAAYQGNLQQSAQRGASMAQFGAGITNETGGRIANTEMQRGTNLAGLDQWRANQAGQYAIGEGHDIAGLNTGEATAQGNNIWNTARGVADLTARGVDARTSALMNLGMAGTALDTQYYNTLAQNTVEKSKFDTANSASGLNNFFKIFGLGAQGATAWNMRNRLGGTAGSAGSAVGSAGGSAAGVDAMGGELASLALL